MLSGHSWSQVNLQLVFHSIHCFLTYSLQGRTWGLVYEVSDGEKIAVALDYLNVREQKIGGYEVYVVPVYPLGYCESITNGHEEESNSTMYSILYIATPECRGYIGDKPYDSLATTIATACGKIGHSIEYLFRLTDFMRASVPAEPDEHLYTLDALVRRKIGLPDEDQNSTWQELLENDDFRRLVFPHKTDYKRLWKNAIALQVRKKSSIDRWGTLLMQIQNMKRRRSVQLQRIDFGNSLDSPDECFGESASSEEDNVNNNNNITFAEEIDANVNHNKDTHAPQASMLEKK